MRDLSLQHALLVTLCPVRMADEDPGGPLIGASVRKHFKGYSWYNGIVVSYDPQESWCVLLWLAGGTNLWRDRQHVPLRARLARPDQLAQVYRAIHRRR